MSEGRLTIEVGKFALTTHIRLDGKPLFVRRLTIVVAAGEKTQVLLDPPATFAYPIFFDVMEAASLISSPVGDYVLVSSELFEAMRHAYAREREIATRLMGTVRPTRHDLCDGGDPDEL
jgi:hypothetical protein